MSAGLKDAGIGSGKDVQPTCDVNVSDTSSKESSINETNTKCAKSICKKNTLSC